MVNRGTEKTLARALELCRRHDWAGAVEAFESALQADPGNPDVWFERGKVLTRLSRLEEALESFGRAIELAPQHADAWYHRGLALTKLGRMQEALDAFQQASKFGSGSLEPQPHVPVDLFLRGLSPSGAADEDSEHEPLNAHWDRKHGFRLDLRFRWEDGGEDLLIVRQVSGSVTEVCSQRYPSCSVSIESKARVPCDYPAKDLAHDLAAEIAGPGGQRRFYVFPNGLLPAYAIRGPQSEQGTVLEDIVVSERFAYRLRRVVGPDTAGEEFARRIPGNFYPLAGAGRAPEP